MDPDPLDDLAYRIIQSAIQVHKALGPGLLESVYRACFLYELHRRHLNVVAERLVPITYEGMVFEGGFRLDLLVEDQIVVEVKSVDAIVPIHRAQLRSYLKLTGKSLGLLINFNVPVLFHGVNRVTTDVANGEAPIEQTSRNDRRV